MTRQQFLFYGLILIILGAGWGITQPLTKIAVSEGYQHFGLLFWQLAIGALVMTCVCFARGERLVFGKAQLLVYLVIALIGSVFPNTASYQAAVHLPSGILSLLLALVPMWAFPIAMLLAIERFSWRRLIGLVLGLSAVALILMPGARFDQPLPVFWVAIALLAGFFYGAEGNYVAKWGTAGLTSTQVLWGASLVGTVLALPLALVSGQWIDPRPPYGAPDLAQVASSVVHVLTYTGYVWLVGKAGPIFTVQVSYFVTIFGLIWARLLLAETYPPTVWIALVMIFVGMFLVQPRAVRSTLDASAALAHTQRQSSGR